MRKINLPLKAFCLSLACFMIFMTGCKEKSGTLATNKATGLNLKRGEIISCGPPDKQFGKLEFKISQTGSIAEQFNLGVKLLHSFEYDEAEKVFAKIIDSSPECAMAYWGVAMANFHPLWTAPTEAELKKGLKAVELAKKINDPDARGKKYIEAIGSFYSGWENADHKTRCLRFEKSMEELHTGFPDDIEASIFYALSLVAAADPTDKTFSKQKKAGELLTSLYRLAPDHPGIIHYIIHTYDSPELAHLALEAARRYASVAPSSAHALHMPSHIFTRLGLWKECILSNQASVSSAICYAQAIGIAGHWDEELHGHDYLEYAYLQRGDNKNALRELNYLLDSIKSVEPANFKVAYAFAAIPARYYLENKFWEKAAGLNINAVSFKWEDYPWQHAIIVFAKTLGAVNSGQLPAAKNFRDELQQLKQKLVDLKDPYKANQVDIELNSVDAWILFREGKKTEALKKMKQAAEQEDHTDKHPVTPGEVIPARELLADMLMEMDQPAEALIEYEKDLSRHANRFNGLQGAAISSEKSGNREKAGNYYKQLISLSDSLSERKELIAAKQFR